jgi:hypothetical protein
VIGSSRCQQIPLQHLSYFPVMMLARFNLYAQSIWFIVTGRIASMPSQRMKFDADVQRYELICKRHSQKSCCVRVGVIGAVVGLIGFWIWFALFHILSFETWQRAIMFLLVSHCYMGVCKLRMMTCARFITVVPIVHVQITLSHWERPFALPIEARHCCLFLCMCVR